MSELRPSPQAGLLEAVFSRPPRSRVYRWSIRTVAWAFAIAVHVVLWVMATRAEPSLESWSARLALRVHEELTRVTVVEVEKPVSSLPPPEPVLPPSAPPAPAPVAPRAATPPASPTPAPPVEAAAVLVNDAPAEILDLTGNTIVSGNAAQALGGATAVAGTGLQPTMQPVDLTAPTAPVAVRVSQAHPVSLNAEAWSCDWPREALLQDIYEEYVTLVVRVNATGQAASVRIVQDPGLGFGQAARQCALRTQFEPARNAAGFPVEAESPQIRVRFVR
jgi:periplasmic protein TonB